MKVIDETKSFHPRSPSLSAHCVFMNGIGDGFSRTVTTRCPTRRWFI